MKLESFIRIFIFFFLEVSVYILLYHFMYVEIGAPRTFGLKMSVILSIDLGVVFFFISNLLSNYFLQSIKRVFYLLSINMIVYSLIIFWLFQGIMSVGFIMFFAFFIVQLIFSLLHYFILKSKK